MFKSFMQITVLKIWDTCWQLGGALFSILAMITGFLQSYVLYLIPVIHILSALYWMLILKGLPVADFRRKLQWSVLLLMPLTLVVASLWPGALHYPAWLILCGLLPFNTIAYFIITFKEIRYYRNLVHRDAI